MKNILLFALLLLFPGCLNYIQDVNLYPDGSGVMHISYWAKMTDSTNFGMLEQVGLFNKDSLKSEFTSPYCKIEEIAVAADSSDTTMHASISLSFESIDSLNNMKRFSDSHFSFVDGASGQKVFTQFISSQPTMFGADTTEYKITYKYSFSGQVIQHNATRVEKKTYIWEYTPAELGAGKTISVTLKPFKLKETPMWIFILSGAVLLTVIIFLFRKKKD